MKTITIHFFKTEGLASAIVRFFTFSHWNHVGITVNNSFYDTEYFRGVTKHKSHNFINPLKYFSIEIDVTNEQAEKIEYALQSKIGMRYDLSALFGLPFRKDWGTTDKWFCSELVAAVLMYAGVINIRVEPYRITPRDLYLILSSEKL